MDATRFASLIDRLKAGDRAAMAALVEEYGGVVRAAVRRGLHDRLRTQFDSLDFVNDVWASVIDLPPDRYAFDTPADLAAFLGRVAHNKVTDVFRQRFRTQKYAVGREETAPPPGRDDSTTAQVAGGDPTPSLVAIAAERWAGLVAKLPPAHRPILERLRDGYTYDEIAAATGVSVSTVNRVVSRLKAVLEEASRP